MCITEEKMVLGTEAMVLRDYSHFFYDYLLNMYLLYKSHINNYSDYKE